MAKSKSKAATRPEPKVKGRTTIKRSYYLPPELADWLSQQGTLEWRTDTSLVIEALTMLREHRRLQPDRPLPGQLGLSLATKPKKGKAA